MYVRGEADERRKVHSMCRRQGRAFGAGPAFSGAADDLSSEMTCTCRCSWPECGRSGGRCIVGWGVYWVYLIVSGRKGRKIARYISALLRISYVDMEGLVAGLGPRGGSEDTIRTGL